MLKRHIGFLLLFSAAELFNVHMHNNLLQHTERQEKINCHISRDQYLSW